MVILEGDPYADAAKWVANRMGWKGIETIRAEKGNERDARLFITNEAGLDKTLKNPLIRRPLVIGHVAKSTPEDLQFPQDRSYILNDVKEQANAFIREEEARLKERNDAEIIRNATDQVPDDVKRDADDFQDNLPPASAPPAKVPPSGDSPLVSDGRPLEQNPYAFATIHSQDSLPDLASNVDEIRSSLELGHGQFTIKESVRSVEQKTEEGKEPTGATDDYQVVKVTFSDDFAPYMSKDIKKIANQIESLTWLFKVDPLSLDFRKNFRKHFRNLNPHQVRSILVDENIASAEHTVDFLINHVQNDEQLQGLLGVKERLADLQIRNKTAYLINVRGLMGMVKAIEKYDNLYKKLGNHEAAYFNFLQQVDYDKRALHDHYRGDLEVSLTRAGLKEKYTELEGESAARVYTALADLQRAYARGTKPESGSYITTYNRKQTFISNQEFEIARQLFQHEIRSLNHHNGYYDNVRWKGARGIMLQHNPTLIKDGGRDGRDAALNGLGTVGRMIDETKAGYGIPVAGMTRQQALDTFMDWYKKEVTLDYNTMFGLYETVDNHNPFANNWKVKNNHWFTRSYLGTPETSGTTIYPPDQVRQAVDRWLADAFDKMTSEKVTDNMPINTSKLSTTFHFDHPMDRYRTMVKYSDYGLTDGIDQQIARMAKQTAYTKNFGLNPEAFSYAENAMNMLEPLSVLAKGDAGKMNSSMWPFLFSYRKLGGDYIGFARNLLELNKIPVNVGIGIASDTLKQLGLVSTGGFIGVSAIADAGGLSHGLRDIFGEALDAKRMDMLFNWSKDAAAKEELSALGTVLEDSAAAMLRVAQDHGIPLTPMLKLTNTFVNWTGVGQVTKAMREKFTSIFTWTVGHQANKSFDQLTPEMRSTIERYDINSNEWDFIRDNVRIIKGDMGEFPAVNELSNYSSDALTHILNKKGHTNPSESIRVRAANEITDKYQRMLRSEMDRRVLLPDSFDTALWTGGTQKGTLSHLVLDNMALFKSFGTAFFRKQLGPAVGDAIKGRPGSRWRLIEFMATMLAIGYVLTIIKDLLSNRKPRVWGKSAFVSSLNNSGIGGLYSSLLADEWSMNEDANVANRFIDYMGGVPKAKVDAYVRAFGSDDPGQFMQRMTKATMGVIPFNNHAAIKGALDIAITQPLSNVFNEEYINNRERFFEEHGTGSVFKWE